MLAADFSADTCASFDVHVFENAPPRNNQDVSHEDKSNRDNQCIDKRVLNECFETAAYDYADEPRHEVAKRDVCLLLKHRDNLFSCLNAALASQEFARAEHAASSCIQNGTELETNSSCCETQVENLEDNACMVWKAHPEGAKAKARQHGRNATDGVV